MEHICVCVFVYVVSRRFLTYYACKIHASMRVVYMDAKMSVSEKAQPNISALLFNQMKNVYQHGSCQYVDNVSHYGFNAAWLPDADIVSIQFFRGFRTNSHPIYYRISFSSIYFQIERGFLHNTRDMWKRG